MSNLKVDDLISEWVEMESEIVEQTRIAVEKFREKTGFTPHDIEVSMIEDTVIGSAKLSYSVDCVCCSVRLME